MSATILVVEDNPDNMKLISWTLEDEGYEFVAVGSAEEALEVLERQPFDLVLTDISLPGMDGKEATRRMRKNPKFATLPIIAVTAHAVKGEDAAILASGVSALVTRPIEEQLLLRTIRSCLQQEVANG
jgi:two-component system cell cycle response regulator DivK